MFPPLFLNRETTIPKRINPKNTGKTGTPKTATVASAAACSLTLPIRDLILLNSDINSCDDLPSKDFNTAFKFLSDAAFCTNSGLSKESTTPVGSW